MRWPCILGQFFVAWFIYYLKNEYALYSTQYAEYNPHVICHGEGLVLISVIKITEQLSSLPGFKCKLFSLD